MNKKNINFLIAKYTTHLMEWMAQRASKRHKNWLDKRIFALLHNFTDTQTLENDYMADELIDSEPSFDPEELESFEKGDSV